MRYRVKVFRNTRQQEYLGSVGKFDTLAIASEVASDLNTIFALLQANCYAEIDFAM